MARVGSGGIHTGMDEQKTCRGCGETKPLDAYAINRRVKRDGRASKCKACFKRYREENAEKVSEAKRRCYRAKSEYYGQKSRQWALAHPERVRENHRRHVAANRDKVRARLAQWIVDNSERNAETRRQWRERNRETLNQRMLVNTRRRRAIRAENPSAPYTLADLEARMSMFGHRCYICGEDGREVDHVKPVTKGGADMLSNFRPICRSCNIRKLNHWTGPAGLGVLIEKIRSMSAQAQLSAGELACSCTSTPHRSTRATEKDTR